MRIAIIGCNSSIASYILHRLLVEPNTALTLYGRRPLQSWDLGPSTQFEVFDFPARPLRPKEMLAYDAIVYCAGAGVQASNLATDAAVTAINYSAPADLLSALSKLQYEGQWISFGTYFELGASQAKRPATENDITSSLGTVTNAYCESKRLFSKFVVRNSFDFPAFHLILPNVYGPGEHSDQLIPYLVGSLRRGEVPRLSAGTQVRQYVHGRDVADLVSLLLTRPVPGGIYNVAGPDVLPIKSLVAMVFARFGQRPDEALGAVQTRDESMPFLQLDGSKLAAALPDWQPQLPLALGLLEYPLHDTFPE